MIGWLCLVALTVIVGMQQWLIRDLSRRLDVCEETLDASSRGCQHPSVKNVGTFGLPVYECEHCGDVIP